MPHVSKNKLQDVELERIYKELLIIFSKAFSGSKRVKFACAFFTKTEQEMFAKRLAIIAMLAKDVPHYHIVQALKVSPSTVERISLAVEIGSMDAIVEFIRKQEKTFTEILEKILSAGLPPITGRGRWKHFNGLLNR